MPLRKRLESSDRQNDYALREACKVRGIMTAGLVVTPGRLTSEALFALRPYARILLVPAEEDDLTELLAAIRA